MNCASPGMDTLQIFPLTGSRSAERLTRILHVDVWRPLPVPPLVVKEARADGATYGPQVVYWNALTDRQPSAGSNAPSMMNAFIFIYFSKSELRIAGVV